MESEPFSSKLIRYYKSFEEIENGLDSFVSDNSTIVEHVTENWASAVTLGFWTKLLKMRQKKVARRKLIARYLRGILSLDSNFVMNVETVKAWRDNAQSVFVTFSDSEIQELYNTIIALKHDPDFLRSLRQRNEFLFYYFLDKISYIERQRDFFNGREVTGPLTYPRLSDLISANQRQIQAGLTAAAALGDPPELLGGIKESQ